MQLNDASLLRGQALIGGAWQDAEDRAVFAVTNPATGAPIGTVPGMGARETRRAIEAARVAQAAWRARPARERSAVLRKWYELMLVNDDDLALLMTTEQGKPLAEARGEV